MTTNANKASESLHARIPHNLLKELDCIAKSMGRSRNWVFTDALKQYLDVQHWQTELIKERLRESRDAQATFVEHNTIVEKHEKRLKAKLTV